MRIRPAAWLPAALIAVAGFTTEAAGGLATVRVPVVKDRTVPLSLEREGVRIVSFRFDRLVRAEAGSLRLGQAGPNVRLSVLNTAGERRAFSLAAAIFDAEGGLLAAGSGDREKLDPGESEELTLTFTGVNQHLSRAAWIYLTIETHPD